jgi:hypothetical protein
MKPPNTDAFTPGRRYRLELRNFSGEVIAPCLYWTIPGDGSLLSAAWSAQTAAPTTRVAWDFEYVPAFLCATGAPETGGPAGGSGTVLPVVFAFNNSVELSFDHGKYSFGTPRSYGTRDTLYLMQAATVQSGAATVGVGIAGQAAVVAASAASTMLSFPVALQLNLGFAAATPGTILDLSAVQQATVIEYPENISALYVTCGKDGQLLVSPHAAPAGRRQDGVDA